jgi:hypothetical protein
MAREEGGRWDVGAKNNAVFLERISESDDRLFEDLLEPEAARELAGLLTKYADKAGESDDSDKSKDSDDSEDSKDPDDSEKADDSDESEKSSK